MEREWLGLLQSKKRLDRERGLQELKQLVDEGRLHGEERGKSEEDVLELITSLSSSWEAKHGGLMATTVLLPHASRDFCDKLKGEIPLLLEYDESRVRLAAGESRNKACTCTYMCMYCCLRLYVCIHILLHVVLKGR